MFKKSRRAAAAATAAAADRTDVVKVVVHGEADSGKTSFVTKAILPETQIEPHSASCAARRPRG